MIEKPSRGGARKGAGRKKKVENGAVINFWISADDIEKLREKYSESLNEKFATWVVEMLAEDNKAS